MFFSPIYIIFGKGRFDVVAARPVKNQTYTKLNREYWCESFHQPEYLLVHDKKKCGFALCESTESLRRAMTRNLVKTKTVENVKGQDSSA